MESEIGMSASDLQGKADLDRHCPPALIVSGPTCSGKSALAMALAERVGGVVINADSMQVYRELRVVTARPDAADLARVPHALYGVRPAADPGNVAWWREAALAAMDAAHAAGRVPILCGGTGLYLAALTEGLAPVPPPGEARDEARAMLAELGAPGLHARLAAKDPGTAATLKPADGQRIARAWEVLRSTGQGLAAWQALPKLPAAPWRFSVVLVDPPRDALRTAIAARFSAMLEAGALDEVAALLALGLDPALPAMRAHGVPELAAHLRGQLSLAAAAERAAVVTGQYTKRQATWFRHHRLAPPDRTHTIHARITAMRQFSESITQFLSIFSDPAG